MDYEKKYNDLIARINAVKNTPKIGMKDKHHYNGYVETGIRDALEYIVTPEPELSEFELKLLDWLSSDTCGEIPMGEMKKCVKNRAAELLDLARKEALRDLPRWRKCDKNTIYNTKFNLVENGVGRFIMVEGYQIDIDSLEKLPGFKEG